MFISKFIEDAQNDCKICGGGQSVIGIYGSTSKCYRCLNNAEKAIKGFSVKVPVRRGGYWKADCRGVVLGLTKTGKVKVRRGFCSAAKEEMRQYTGYYDPSDVMVIEYGA